MGSSYCGKNCDDCLDKAEVGCPGCKSGPGKSSGALCEIARCCNDRLSGGCATCASNVTCGMLVEREAMLQKWNRNKSNANAGTAVTTGQGGTAGSTYGGRRNRSKDGRDATLIRKSLIAIFWLFLATGIGTFLTNENLFGNIPVVILLGTLVSFGSGIAQAVLMIRLGWEESAYKVAGICMLVGVGLSLVGGACTGYFMVMVKYSNLILDRVGLIFGILLLVAAVILEVIGAYQFIVANARVVERRDPELSVRWYMMSKLFFAVLGGIILVPILIFLLKIIGIIVALLYVLGVLAFGICEYVFLYQTAERFRE